MEIYLCTQKLLFGPCFLFLLGVKSLSNDYILVAASGFMSYSLRAFQVVIARREILIHKEVR
jgi:hypothetical protein